MTTSDSIALGALAATVVGFAINLALTLKERQARTRDIDALKRSRLTARYDRPRAKLVVENRGPGDAHLVSVTPRTEAMSIMTAPLDAGSIELMPGEQVAFNCTPPGPDGFAVGLVWVDAFGEQSRVRTLTE